MLSVYNLSVSEIQGGGYPDHTDSNWH